LWADAGRVARALAAHPPGEVLLICADRYLFAAALLGAWASGHIVRLPPNGQPETLRSLTAEASVRALLHDRTGAGEGIAVPALLEGPEAVGELTLPPMGRHLVTVTTSGSTGAHQRWPKTGDQLLSEAALLARLFDVGPDARILTTVPPHHIYGLLFGVLLPLRAGAALVREGSLHAESLVAALRRQAVTHLVSVPAHLASLAEAEAAPPLRRVFSSGSPLPAAASAALRSRFGWRVTEVYGSTETGGVGWRERPEEDWTPFPDVTIGTDDADRLLVDSPRLAPGSERPFPCGDRIARSPDGRFRLLGRADGVVKVGGKRVSLREVEERLLALPGVRDVAALAVPSPGARAEEVWVAASAPGYTPEVLRARLAEWLDPVTLPRRIRVVEALPREATGKLVRERLRALLEAPPLPPRLTLEPEREQVLPAPDGVEVRRLELTVPPDLRWFQGHFPGKPVLPGVVQLEGLVLRQTLRLWPDLGSLRSVRRLKFKRPISPGMPIAVILTCDRARATVAFEIEGSGDRFASGTLIFASGGSR
jgi:4-coumarate--CoA ligase (photoactive yellow protein activation family)